MQQLSIITKHEIILILSIPKFLFYKSQVPTSLKEHVYNMSFVKSNSVCRIKIAISQSLLKK